MTASATHLRADPVILRERTRDRLIRAIAEGKIYAPYAYQARRLASDSKFNLDLWARQTGKSQTNAQDAVHLAATTGESVMLLSASRDLTSELMLKVAIYAEVICGMAGEIQRSIARGEMDELLYVDHDGVHVTQTVITLPNGERIVGRPANPRTARGFSMHVKLDEFGMHREPDEIWAAAFPSISARPHLRLDVISTPGLRTDDKFADLCGAAIRGDSDFRFSKVTIHDAVADGYPADPDLLRRNLRDEDLWRREFLCEFVDEAGAYLTYELIRACEHEGITARLPPDPDHWNQEHLGWDPGAGDLWMGVDIGRRHDLTVFWLLQSIGDVHWTRAVIAMEKAPFSIQETFGDVLLARLPVRRACVDETGIGMMLCEHWQERFGTYRVEGLTYTSSLKAVLAPWVRAAMEDRGVRIPVDVKIRESLHSVRKTVTAAGNIRYAGERTPDGHADEFWALANALHAINSGVECGLVEL